MKNVLLRISRDSPFKKGENLERKDTGSVAKTWLAGTKEGNGVLVLH